MKGERGEGSEQQRAHGNGGLTQLGARGWADVWEVPWSLSRWVVCYQLEAV